MDLLTLLTPSVGKLARACIVKGLQLCWPKAMAKAQTKPQATDVAVAQAQASVQAPRGAQAPAKAPQ